MDPYQNFNPFETSPQKSPPHPFSSTRPVGTPSRSPRLRSASMSGCPNCARLESVLHEHEKIIKKAHLRATEAKQESYKLAEHLYHSARAMQEANTSREKLEGIMDDILDYTELGCYMSIPHYPLHVKQESPSTTPRESPSRPKSPFRDNSPPSQRKFPQVIELD
ncbi:hypothetical protein CsatB_014054 [Cannabis sativa]